MALSCFYTALREIESKIISGRSLKRSNSRATRLRTRSHSVTMLQWHMQSYYTVLTYEALTICWCSYTSSNAPCISGRPYHYGKITYVYGIAIPVDVAVYWLSLRPSFLDVQDCAIVFPGSGTIRHTRVLSTAVRDASPSSRGDDSSRLKNGSPLPSVKHATKKIG